MRELHFTAAVVLSSALLWASHAKAEPPPEGLTASFSKPAVVCDTKEEIVAIAKAGENGNHAAVETAFKELYDKTNSKGEHTCMVAPVIGMTFGESEDIGFSTNVAGEKVKVWASHFGNMHGDWWLLYAEASHEAPKSG